MNTVVFAYHNLGCIGLQSLVDAGYTIKAVFTHTDDPGETRFFDSVAHQAAELGLPVFAPENVNHELWMDRIREWSPEVLFSFYYRNLISDAILSLAPMGGFNLHGSLLPRYRGRAPVNWAVLNGEKETGLTLHKMVRKPDAGDIVGQCKVSIDENDTALSVHAKLAGAARPLLADLLPGIRAKQFELSPQNEAEATCFGRRHPEDGEIDWHRPADDIFNLVRAVTEPYPGAFTYFGQRKTTVWKARVLPDGQPAQPEKSPHVAGTVLSTDPLTVRCGQGVLEVIAGQTETGIYQSGVRLAAELGLSPGATLSKATGRFKSHRTRVLLLGVNGFIGNHLTERLLRDGNYEVYGMDISADAISRFLNCPDFFFVEGDISINREWIEYHIKKCDVIIPLVAIATPIEYTRNPLRVFELDFEENLKIVRNCVKYNKRILFPSTSEVYGMCDDDEFNEETSQLIVGPINKQRWIYSTSKQLLDRVIWAYGERDGLRFTLFRPFNWMGPRLDNLDAARIGSSRAITQLILNLVDGTPFLMVDGGEQKRCFTDISEGIEALFRIIENRDGRCDGQIINIGNPENEASIRQLAEMLLDCFQKHPLASRFPAFAGFRVVESRDYYGKGYQDMGHRRPSITNARRLLSWNPEISLRQTVEETLDFFLRSVVEQGHA